MFLDPLLENFCSNVISITASPIRLGVSGKENLFLFLVPITGPCKEEMD